MDLHVTMQWETALLWNTVQKYARQVTKAKEEEVAAARGEGRSLIGRILTLQKCVSLNSLHSSRNSGFH